MNQIGEINVLYTVDGPCAVPKMLVPNRAYHGGAIHCNVKYEISNMKFDFMC